MKVFKFGGASVSSAEKIRNVAEILKSYKGENILVVVSALGKTTNALEKVVKVFFAGEVETAFSLFRRIREEHVEIATGLMEQTVSELDGFFTEMEWLLHDKPVKKYDYYYDQLVCLGELLSSSIVSNYLNKTGVLNVWIDVRDIIRTDNNFREAKIDWEVTDNKVGQIVRPYFTRQSIVLTQGFIGATDENESTTLGREGSDYTAAVFANMLDAESLTIWKDVQGVMNADPKEYRDAQWIKELNYREVIEMAYYGAQVIHPKTIKPLQNKSIPLFVRSFIHPETEGTLIHNNKIHGLPPIIVYKYNQVLLQLTSKDFSFVSEGPTGEAYKLFQLLKFEPNMTQNAAISLLCVVDEHPEKIDQFAHDISAFFDTTITRGLTLLTIRHYNDRLVEKLCRNSRIILQQQTTDNLQVLMEVN